MIPARGGPKRIPHKNVKSFHGQPMIAHSIAAALASDRVDRLIVSTDDEEIADIARTYGAEVPFRRAAHLADDHATTINVIADALEWAEREESTPVEALLCLYATAPFTRGEDLRAAFDIFSRSEAAFVFAAAEYAYPIQRALTLRNGRLEMFQPEHSSTRSQDLEPAYHDAGQFYWCRPEAVHRRLPIFGPQSMLYPMDRSRVQDIDTPDDWIFAERLFALLQAQADAQS